MRWLIVYLKDASGGRRVAETGAKRMQAQSTVVDHWTEIRRTAKEWLDLFPLSNSHRSVNEATTIPCIPQTHGHLWSDLTRARFLLLVVRIRQRLDTQSKVALVVGSKVWVTEHRNNGQVSTGILILSTMNTRSYPSALVFNITLEARCKES